MKYVTCLAALCAVAVSIAGCDPLDRLEGKSPGREHAERLAMLADGMPAAVVTAATEPEPAPAPVLPVCRFSDAGFLICN